MKNLSVLFKVPAIFVKKNDETVLIPSMFLSTLSVCALATFVPQLMPLWMELSSNPGK